ncbi:MAG: hypothetical protein ACRC9V_08130, partial [Aeromonas sp.]
DMWEGEDEDNAALGCRHLACRGYYAVLIPWHFLLRYILRARKREAKYGAPYTHQGVMSNMGPESTLC